ncbi:MAG: type I-MYXAN CRISPR-associated protein Cas6/Cmx6 [Sterolibacterium sp.]
MNGSAGSAEEVVDVVFAVHGSAIAPDYAVPLWQALRMNLPWLAEEADAAVLPLARVAHTQTALFLGRHSRLELRLPQRRVAAAQALCGRSLNLGEVVGYSGTLEIGAASLRSLRPTAVQYSSCVALSCAVEADFVSEAGRLLAQQGIDAQLICGKAQTQSGAEGENPLQGFSLMLHGLSREHSLCIQRSGLGAGRKLGWGIFVPHRSVAAVAN